MALVKTKPTSPGRRFVIKIVNPELHKGEPFAPLVVGKRKTGGRNNAGRITTRHIGGGHKRRYRLIDFKRDKENIPGKVEHLEYDPNRSAYLALVLYADGERRYMIATQQLKVGDEVISSKEAPIKPGNCLFLRDIPVGTVICCVETKPGKGAQFARSAGTSVQLLAKEGGYATIKMRSGEVRKVLVDCKACIGEVSNQQHNLRSIGKAGAKRWRGKKPHVRGVAMNPVDHPMGGGEGKTSGGGHPVSPWGQKSKGLKTRRNKRTRKYIVHDRRKKI